MNNKSANCEELVSSPNSSLAMSTLGSERSLPAGRFRYVKINRWRDRHIKIGQCMFLKDPETWEVTGKSDGVLPIGVALNNHRYHWWEYALWLITRMIRFSPVRYVFIQESGYVSADIGQKP